MDGEQTERQEELERLRAAVEEAAAPDLVAITEDARPQELVEIWEELPGSRQADLLGTLPPDKAAEILANLPEETQPQALEALPDARAQEILEALDPDDLADALQNLEEHAPERAEALKARLDPEIRATAEELTRYEEDEAGGLMTPEFVSVRASMTASRVIEFLRRAAPEAETVYYIYVVESDNRLLGVLSLRDLIVSAPERTVREIMIPDVVHVTTDTDQEEVARLMADYDFSVLPVVDGEGRLVGIVTVDDVIDVIEDEATEDIHRLGAAPVDIDYARASPWLMFRKRVPWLGLLLVSMSLTFNVISRYEGLLERVTILAAFIPLLIGTGGNVGSQIATVVVRALAMRELETSDFARVLVKEMVTGLCLGATLAVFMYAYVMIFRGDASIATALAITMVLIALCANLVGATLPFLFRRFGIDPALTSSPGITTVMDVVGLLIYFQVVLLILGRVFDLVD
jgi:magnesium transporter